MASRFFFTPLFHPTVTLRAPVLAAGIGLGLGLGLGVFQSHRSRFAYRLDTTPSSSGSKDWSFSGYRDEARTPVVTPEGKWNARAVRQLSAGSIIGLVAGLGVSVFSKPLALLLGLLVVGIQTAESYGIHLVPYTRMQRYVRGIDLRSAVQDNVAFKLSFGMMFALSAFAEF